MPRPTSLRPSLLGLPGPLAILVAVVLLAVVPACSDTSVPVPLADMAPVRLRTTDYIENLRPKIDILFMVDNSNSAGGLQIQLRQAFARFFKPFEDLAQRGTYADLHIGVVTSDFGAGASGAPACTPSGLNGGGDQGKLIAVGRKAASNCKRPKGSNYVEYHFSAGEPLHNLPANQGLLETFTCMSSVGENGCGFEHPLESVYAALHNNIADNQGFLRDDALLMVLFLTDEDDASAPPDSDIFDKNKAQEYGYLSGYSRQTRFAVMCGDPPAFPPYADSKGPLHDCRPAPNPDGVHGPGKMFDVSRYRDLFRLPRVEGGLKDDPADVILVAIDAPEEPFQVILSNPGTPAGEPLVPCDTLSYASNPPCVPVLQHSCVNANRPYLSGDPAVRLNDVVRSVKLHQVTSSCDEDYGPALESAARLAVSTLGGNCILDAFPRDAAGQPIVSCQGYDLTLEADGSETRTTLPRCDDAAHPTNTPCWSLEDKPVCHGLSPDGVGFSILRGTTNGLPNQAPPRTTAHVKCQTVTRP